MSPRFDEVARLNNLLGRREAIIERENDTRTVNHGLIEKLAIERYISAASPWLLEVAGCFQPGDVNLMGELISVMDAYFGEYYRPHKAAMHRLLQAAKIMEEKESTTHD